MKSLIFSVLFLIQTSQIYSHANPSEVNGRCSVWDNACFVGIAQNLTFALAAGVPERGLEKLDPLFVPHFLIHQDGLKCYVEHLEIHGLTHAVFNNGSLDKFAKRFRLIYTLPKLVLKSKYEASGFIHYKAFNGKGDLEIKADHVEIDAIYDYDLREDGKGRKFAELKSFYYSFDVKVGATFAFSDLFNGDHVQSDALHAYLNEHWKIIIAEYGRNFLDKLLERKFESLKIYLHSLPLDDLFYDY